MNRNIVMPYQNSCPFNWVPTGHSLRISLNAYLAFRQTNPHVDNRASFIAWCQENLHQENGDVYQNQTLNAICFPLGASEFNMFGRPMDQIQTIVAGGIDGLKIAYGSLVFQMPTVREKVCLVDAWVTGCVYHNHAVYDDRVCCVLQQNYAGTKNAANTLLAVGRSVGRHFGLLDAQNLPTPLFVQFFGQLLPNNYGV